jgi:hypothetical protein
MEPSIMMRPISLFLAILLLLQTTSVVTTGQSVAGKDLHLSETTSKSNAGGTEIPEPQRIEPLQIPDGTLIEIEAPYRINSKEFKPNDEISFRVINPIKINGVTVIEQGANATGRIERAKRGGHFGKAGLLVWSMQSVTAVDGSKVSLRAVRERLRGDSKAAKVATQMVVTGALLLVFAPLALLHGFKRGKDAFIPAGKRYDLFVNGQAVVKVN